MESPADIGCHDEACWQGRTTDATHKEGIGVKLCSGALGSSTQVFLCCGGEELHVIKQVAPHPPPKPRSWRLVVVVARRCWPTGARLRDLKPRFLSWARKHLPFAVFLDSSRGRP